MTLIEFDQSRSILIRVDQGVRLHIFDQNDQEILSDWFKNFGWDVKWLRNKSLYSTK